MSGLADARVSSNCAPATGTMSPAATSLSFVSNWHFEGSRGGRLPSRLHAALQQTSHIRIGYPIHHFRGRKLVRLRLIVDKAGPGLNLGRLDLGCVLSRLMLAPSKVKSS
jgi:hypothetical protein